jgi:hypothetical protein
MYLFTTLFILVGLREARVSRGPLGGIRVLVEQLASLF